MRGCGAGADERTAEGCHDLASALPLCCVGINSWAVLGLEVPALEGALGASACDLPPLITTQALTCPAGAAGEGAAKSGRGSREGAAAAGAGGEGQGGAAGMPLHRLMRPAVATTAHVPDVGGCLPCPAARHFTLPAQLPATSTQPAQLLATSLRSPTHPPTHPSTHLALHRSGGSWRRSSARSWRRLPGASWRRRRSARRRSCRTCSSSGAMPPSWRRCGGCLAEWYLAAYVRVVQLPVAVRAALNLPA